MMAICTGYETTDCCRRRGGEGWIGSGGMPLVSHTFVPGTFTERFSGKKRRTEGVRADSFYQPSSDRQMVL